MTSTKDTKGRDEATIRFLRRSFSDYYANAKLQLPDRFGRREWGFMFFGRDMMLRHMALRSSDEMRAFLRREGPAHAYHSTAYYEKPDAQTMKDKKWLGADLIFDLDADHIEGSAAMSYEQMLSVVKREIIRLAEEFVLGDLGFDAEHVHLVFSGGRGYHIHVTDPSVLELDSRERREIVDYITGVGLDLDRIFKREIVGERGRGSYRKPVSRWTMPPKNAPGWEGRMTRATLYLLDELEAKGEQAAVEKMAILGESGKRGLVAGVARRLYADLFSEKGGGVRGVDKMRADGIIDVFSKEELASWFFEMIKETAGVKLEKKRDERITEVKATGETDEPVTSDIKRLIRLPTSLHGKTGFCVVPLSIDEVKGFDPLKDAVVMPDNEVGVEVKKALQVRLKGQEFKLEPGPARLPAYAAVFAMGRGAAIVAPESASSS
jgi:DNA primase small subunit